MGQAVVDLPDPLEEPPASAASADDLLAQLAGDEIDRLLNDAEAEGATEPVAEISPAAIAPATGTPRAVEPVAHAAESTIASMQDAAASIDSLLDEPASAIKDEQVSSNSGRAESIAGSSETPIAASSEPTSVPTPTQQAENAAALDAILNEVASAEGSKAASVDIDSAVAAAADKILSPSIEAARQAGDAVDEPAKSHEATERDGLLAAVADEPEGDDEPPAPLPLWLRPLEWINAPVNDSSDRVREFLGKAAILTLVNSAAVIVYVLMFRKH